MVAGLFWAIVTWHLTRREVGGDYYFHLAGLAELRRSLLDPRHPFLPTTAPEVTFTPYAVALAVLGKGIGASAVDLLAWIAPVNLALLFVAFGRFAWRITRHVAVPSLALVITLLVWGSRPWVWSGHLDVGSLGATASYPSTIAIAVLFAALCVVLGLPAGDEPLSARRLAWPCVLLAVAAWFDALTHPFTGGWLGLLAVVLLLVRPLSWRVRGWAAGSLAAGALVALTWPWFPLGHLLLDNGRFDASQDLLTQSFASRNWPYLVGVAFAVWRLVRNRRDPLAVLALTATAVLAVGLAWRPVLVRIDGVAFALLAVVVATEAVELVGRLRYGAGATGERRWVPAAAVGVGLAVVAASLAANPRLRLVLTPPPLRAESEPSRQVNHFDQFAFARGRAGDEVLLVPFPLVIGTAAFTDGAKQQSTPWVAVFEPSDVERRADGQRFWEPTTSASDRLAIIDTWGVTGVLLPPGDALGGELARGGWTVAWEGPEGRLWVERD